MSERSEAILDDRRVHRLAPPVERARAEGAAWPPIDIAVHDNLDSIEPDWRRFQASADCTVFQTFEWLAAWQFHIGRHERTAPAIVAGRRPDGELLFLIPLAVTPGLVRRLTFLGSELSDYNAPLLAPDFGDHVRPDRFRDLWRRICDRLMQSPQHRYDLIDLTKMPETVGAQPNPFLALGGALHPSGAHLMDLHGTWEQIYRAKRSSVTRRRDRTKRKRLGELGDVQMVTPTERDEVARTMDGLIAQKAAAFARMGVGNMFARPGHRDFFLDLATDPRLRDLVHVSRLDVGATWAASNFGLQFHGCYYHVLASYDDGPVSRFGPGAAHLRDLISRAIGAGFRRFDFTVGDERYKLEWSDTALKLYDHVAAAAPLGWLVAKQTVIKRRLKRLIKQNPQLFDLFNRARCAVGALRGARPRAEELDTSVEAERAGDKVPPR